MIGKPLGRVPFARRADGKDLHPQQLLAIFCATCVPRSVATQLFPGITLPVQMVQFDVPYDQEQVLASWCTRDGFAAFWGSWKVDRTTFCAGVLSPCDI